MIPYKFLSLIENVPANGYWDQALISDLLSDKSIFREMTDEDTGGIIIFPGAYQAGAIDALSEYLQKLTWVILIITSDEESKFPIEEVNHQNIIKYIQYPKYPRHEGINFLPIGYTSETRKNLNNYPKTNDVFLACQDNHVRRNKCFSELEKNVDKFSNLVIKTEGFAQGINQNKYIEAMCKSKIAPCPSGAVSQDSFRVYEALESGAIPIADNISPSGDVDFWEKSFGIVSFPTINNYSDLSGYIEDNLINFQEKANNCQAWWILEKRAIKKSLINNFFKFTNIHIGDMVSVIIPISYIPSHPSTAILEKTIKSIRYHLPDVEIFLTFDGLREEHKEHKSDYDEFIKNALFLANTEWGNVVPLLFYKHSHQALMARYVLQYINTQVILYVEQDTPLVTDEPIEWDYLIHKIIQGDANVIRFHFEAFIPKVHEHLMLGYPYKNLLKTIQWSQRPHLASTAFYRKIITQYFSENANCFIEDVLHGKLQQEYAIDGVMAWNQWRVYIYHPEGGNIKRSLNLDGREGTEKFDDKQTF